ncbi:hypothetical protein P7C70_g2167, partial [Phenoliferia sp. Uapishka_3]
MHRSADSRRYRNSEMFEVIHECEPLTLRPATYVPDSSPGDTNPRGPRWKENLSRTGNSTSRRRVTARNVILVGLVGAFTLACLPRHQQGIAGEEVSSLESMLVQRDMDAQEQEDLSSCNPYDLPGVLITNWTEPSENKWSPIAAPASCQPIDWLAMLRISEKDGTHYPQLDWASNRTVAIFGDSVDRDHVEHTCDFIGGTLERIGEQSPFSPDYPPGQELPPEDSYDAPVVPDLISVSVGFWDLLKHSIFDDAERDEEVQAGRNPHEATLAFDTYRSMPVERRAWFERRIKELFLHIAETWPGGKGSKPKIMLRALHHPQANHLVPVTGVQVIDQISRSVVAQLVAEGQAAEVGEEAWKRWSKRAQSLLSLEPVDGLDEGRTYEDVLKLGLGSRLGIDEWGRNILGQELRQRDALHPLPLPSNYLYGNMLFE